MVFNVSVHMTNERKISIAIIGLFLLSVVLQFVPQKQAPVLESGEGVNIIADSLFKKDGIAVVHVSGPIYFSQNSSSPLFAESADLILRQLSSIERDEHVKGVLLKINSPGGTVGASQEILAAVQRLKEKRDIPIVAQIGDMGASGAYYVALGADSIFANRGSIVGSIGVIMSGLTINELAERYGIKNKTYKSGPYKDIFSMWRDSTPAEDQLIQTMIDNVYEQFLDDLISSREMNPSQARSLAQGQVFTGMQAHENGLVDEIGTYHDAIRYLGDKTGLGEYPHIITKSKANFMDFANVWSSSLKQRLFSSAPLQLQ